MERPSKTQLNLSKFCQMHLSRCLARRLPFRLSQAYLASLGRLYYLRHPEEREFICHTIRRVFGPRLDEGSLQKLFRQTFEGIFTHYHEKLFLAYAPEDRVKMFLIRRLQVQGADELRTALAYGRGVILVTGHFGAVEFLPAALGLHGYPAAIIVRPQTKELALSLTQRAALINLTLIIPEDGKVMPAALKALREGRILVTEADEFEMWRPDPMESIKFLGFPLPADRTLHVLQKRSGSPLLTALVRREPSRNYTLRIAASRAAPADQADRWHYLRLLEQAILADPEQWYQWKEFGKVIRTLPERLAPPVVHPFPAPARALANFAPA